MKKVLSLILSLLMLVSLLAVPVSAGADDGFNDGQFGSWGDDEPVVPPVDPEPPVEPDVPEGPNGTKENPYPIGRPADVPTEVELAAGACEYYQFPALKFTGWTLAAMSATSVDFNGTMITEIDLASRAIKITLNQDGDLVGFYNESDEDVIVTLDLKQPVGTLDDPYRLEDGDNTVTVPVDYPEYYAMYNPTSNGEYILNASDFANFDVYVDADGDPTTTENRVKLTEQITITCESYIPLYFIVCRTGSAPDITLSVTPPAKGTESNPYWISNYGEMLDGELFMGDAMWPASEDGIWYYVDGWNFNNTTLLVTGQEYMAVIVNGAPWVKVGDGEFTMEVPLELGENDAFRVCIQSTGNVKLDVVFPAGTENNPQVLNNGKNTLALDDLGTVVYATYTAIKDGVLIINPHTVNGLGYTDAYNVTLDDYETGYDFVFGGVEGEGASEDFVLTIPVSKGDVVKITTCAGENEDFEIFAMDLNLYVCYEADHKMSAATCTKASTCSACGLTVGEAQGHKYTTVTKKATTKANGYTVKRCSVCAKETGKKTLYQVTSITLSKTSYTYNGKVQKPTVTVKNAAGTKLTEGTSYTVSYASGCKTAGTYKVTVTLKGNYEGTVTKTFKINPIDVSKCTVTLSKTSYTYNGKVQKPTVTVKNASGTKLTEGGSYTVTYASGCKSAGTYKVTIKMKGNYTGTVTKTFKIAPQDVSKCKITLSATSYTYNGAVKKPTVTVKNAAGTKLTEGGSYTVTYATGRKNVGTYKVTIKMKGNYTGTKTITFKILPTKTSISSLTAGTKKLTVKWAKKTTQVTGYEIQYSTSKTFASSVKTKTITKNSTVSTSLTGLSAKKTYYVRIRTYKTVNGVKIYSGWSTVKSLKTK